MQKNLSSPLPTPLDLGTQVQILQRDALTKEVQIDLLLQDLDSSRIRQFQHNEFGRGWRFCSGIHGRHWGRC